MRQERILTGKRAVVTGAGSGIGRAVAEQLAADGAHVLLLDRDAKTVASAAAAIAGDPYVIDLADPEAVASLELDADILVNCAGIQQVAPIVDLDAEVFVRMQRLMVETPFRLTQKVLPGMYERSSGRIVHISSVHGQRASAFKSAYVTAKHAIEGLSKVIALEGASRGVTSNTVCPGYVRTPLIESQIADLSTVHGITEADVINRILLTRSAIRRLAEPAEVAAAVAYLCSPAASFVTGTSITLDGGWTAA